MRRPRHRKNEPLADTSLPSPVHLGNGDKSLSASAREHSARMQPIVASAKTGGRTVWSRRPAVRPEMLPPNGMARRIVTRQREQTSRNRSRCTSRGHTAACLVRPDYCRFIDGHLNGDGPKDTAMCNSAHSLLLPSPWPVSVRCAWLAGWACKRMQAGLSPSKIPECIVIESHAAGTVVQVGCTNRSLRS